MQNKADEVSTDKHEKRYFKIGDLFKVTCFKIRYNWSSVMTHILCGR